MMIVKMLIFSLDQVQEALNLAFLFKILVIWYSDIVALWDGKVKYYLHQKIPILIGDIGL